MAGEGGWDPRPPGVDRLVGRTWYDNVRGTVSKSPRVQRRAPSSSGGLHASPFAAGSTSTTMGEECGAGAALFFRLALRASLGNTEPYGSAFLPPRHGLRGPVGSDSPGDPRATRARRRLDQRAGRELRDDPHGHEQAREDPGGGGGVGDGGGRASAALRAGRAPAGG